jgi:hypothetical protein
MIVPPSGHTRAACCLLMAISLSCIAQSNDACGGCPGEQVCLGVQLADGGHVAQCGTLSEALGPCGPSIPAACDSLSLECVTAGGPDGFCYQLCDPAGPACTTGLSCLAVLSTFDAGICAKPGAGGTSCNEGQQVFCPVGQICLDAAGLCLKRCDPALSNNCPQLESCVTPDPAEPGLSVCVQPQPIGSNCSPLLGIFCDNGAFCVSLPDAGGRCLKDCTDGGACPPTQACLAIGDQNIIRGACF